jgi:osmotically-inducible protein OsmY
MEPNSNSEDAFHVLQEPQPTSVNDPYVGNETVDENLAESAQVALWNAISGRCDGIVVSAIDGRVTVCGGVETPADAQHCEAAIRAVPGVRDVVNNLTWNARTNAKTPA